jgi:hypothetical protein
MKAKQKVFPNRLNRSQVIGRTRRHEGSFSFMCKFCLKTIKALTRTRDEHADVRD